MATQTSTLTPKASSKTPKATPKATAPKVAVGSIAIHINKTGRVCFSKQASERIGKLAHARVTTNGKSVQILPVAKSAADTVAIRYAGTRPYISATKALKATGLFDGTKAFDVKAIAMNGNGFELRIA